VHRLAVVAPLGVALLALAVRELARPRASDEPGPRVPATEVMPPLQLLAAAGRPRDATLRVETQASKARIASAGSATGSGMRELAVAGSLRIRADDSLCDVDLELSAQRPQDYPAWQREYVLHLRGAGARSHATAVPGVRACTLRALAVLGQTTRAIELPASWIRLPDGSVVLQATGTLDWTPFDLPDGGWARMLPRSAPEILGIDLLLRAER
jgi:hypothetical protein